MRRLLLAIAFGGGVLIWLTFGLALAVLLCPLLVVGVPALLRSSTAATDVARLTAIEQWTRGMSGVLTVGSGIEHAIAASVGSTPPAIAPMVSTLAARLNARWPTDAALRAFADDLDDATGDLVAATLILGRTGAAPAWPPSSTTSPRPWRKRCGSAAASRPTGPSRGPPPAGSPS